nr:hypothetical protein [Paeniclostridium ghonii]
MELILILIACILGFIFIKYLLKKVLLCLFILALSGVISFFYKIPYSISVFSVSILIYSIYSIFSEMKNISCKVFKSRKSYLDGWSEKLVDLLFSANYIVFMITCYMLLMRISLSMIDIFELGIAFLVTWICIWLVGHSKSFILKYIKPKEYGI